MNGRWGNRWVEFDVVLDLRSDTAKKTEQLTPEGPKEYELAPDEEILCKVRAWVSSFDPGQMAGPPENCYPPEGGEVEEVEVIRRDTRRKVMNLSDENREIIEDIAVKRAQEVGDDC